MTDEKGTAKVVKNVLKVGLVYFASMYLGFGGYVVLDHKLRHEEVIKKKAKNTLIVKNYKVTLEDKVKELTILGEVHLYNYKESEFAEDFIDNFDYVACEGGIGGSDILLRIFSKSYYTGMKFYGLGSGRYSTNTTMHSWAKKKGKTIYYLEQDEDSYKNNMNLSQRLTLTGIGLFSFTTGPLSYFSGKNKLEMDQYTSTDHDYLDNDSYLDWATEGDEGWGDWAVNLRQRDTIMVKNILKVLEKDDVDSLLCIMGKAHVPGVLKKLKDEVDLEKVDMKTLYNPKPF